MSRLNRLTIRVAPLLERADFPRRMSSLPYPGGVINEGGDTGSRLPLPPTPPRRFGQMPNDAIPDDFDEPLPPTEAAVWQAPDATAQDASAALDDAWLDLPLD